jgi:hypothetical protein
MNNELRVIARVLETRHAPPADAQNWLNAGFEDPEEIAEWLDAGCLTAEAAQKLEDAGFTSAQAAFRASPDETTIGQKILNGELTIEAARRLITQSFWNG